MHSPRTLSGKTPTKSQVLIVHRAPLTRFALRLLLRASKRFQVCAETDDAPMARELVTQYHPTLVVLGLTLRRGSGVQLIKDFRRLDQKLAALIISERDDVLSIQRAFHAGARGYYSVCDDPQEVLKALDQISVGGTYLSPGLLPQVLKNFASGKIQAEAMLSDRELEVLSLIGRGFGASQVARELNISVKTVETYEMRIKEKFGLDTAAELRERAKQLLLKSGPQLMTTWLELKNVRPHQGTRKCGHDRIRKSGSS